MYIRNYFLKQSRRDKSSVAQYARSAIRACLALVVFLALVSPLTAQHRDTLYVVEEEPVYDTLFVHDTLRVHDTLVPSECTTRWSRCRRIVLDFTSLVQV